MKTKAKKSSPTKELSFELKYCECCGGLWLRPAGGGQTYCVGCARQMAELPAPSDRPETARMHRGPRWRVVERAGSDGDKAMDVDVAGGGA